MEFLSAGTLSCLTHGETMADADADTVLASMRMHQFQRLNAEKTFLKYGELCSQNSGPHYERSHFPLTAF